MLKKEFNLKKNFFRVKQLADQGFGRAEKTALSEDLQNAEKKVEGLKAVLHNLVKRLQASLHAHAIQDQEKRMKKMPIIQLAGSLTDNSQQLGDCLLSQVLSQCAEGLTAIGTEKQAYELIVEKTTLSVFQKLLDTDLPAIKKSKTLLSKLTLDMDAARSRQQSATKESSHHPSSQNTTKMDTLSQELEDAEHKVESCRDQYQTEMHNFISKEEEISKHIVEWMNAKVSYYRKSLTHLEDMVPELNVTIDQHSSRPVYGCPLDEHLQTTGKEIAFVIEACISVLYHEALEEEGLFRIAGSSSKLKKLKAAFNVGGIVDLDEYYSDFHVVAGALKQYIRELPEPLLTFPLFKEFISCMSVKDRDARLRQLWTAVQKLPKSNVNNVKYLIKFLAKLAEKSDINKMTPSNIAIVFGPNLLWDEDSDNGSNVAFSGVQNQVVETLVQNHDYFFPGEVQFDDVETVTGHPHNSVEKRSSLSHPSPAPSPAKEEPPTLIKTKHHTEPPASSNIAASSALSNSQHSISSTDSSGHGTAMPHSPLNYRKSKKPAPPPPPTFSPVLNRDVQSKPDRPETKPEQSIQRHDTVRKPTMPPPGPPTKPVTRPSNPPPPTPTAINQIDTVGIPVNPFLDDDSLSASAAPTTEIPVTPVLRSTSDEPKLKTHARHGSADITANQSVSPEVKGHSRAKSHDYKLRQPPPIPQRTHSIPTKHSFEDKRWTSVEGDKSTASKSEPSLRNDNAVGLLVDLEPQTSPSNSKERVDDTIVESPNEPTDDELEYRDRMNSKSDFTDL